eukprot:gene19782-biopygen11550
MWGKLRHSCGSETRPLICTTIAKLNAPPPSTPQRGIYYQAEQTAAERITAPRALPSCTLRRRAHHSAARIAELAERTAAERTACIAKRNATALDHTAAPYVLPRLNALIASPPSAPQRSAHCQAERTATEHTTAQHALPS